MPRKFRPLFLEFRVLAFLGLSGFASGQAIPSAILKNLSSEKFAERESAEEALFRWSGQQPQSAVQELLRQAFHAEDPELRVRCMAALKRRVLAEEYKGQGFLGINMMEMVVKIPGEQELRRAIRISAIQPGTAAEHAGLKANQLIVALGGRVWLEDGMQSDFARVILDTSPGSEVTLTLLEGEKLIKKKIRVGVRPELPGEDGKVATDAAKERFFSRWLDKRGAAAR
jgi:S1-C subfamily serine protease